MKTDMTIGIIALGIGIIGILGLIVKAVIDRVVR
jgi:hypothetical protein